MATLIPKSLDVLKPGIEYPFIVQALDTQLRKACSKGSLLLPNLLEHTETIFIASDYGGESADSRYFTYSFVVVSYNAMATFISRQKELREKHGLLKPFKEIAFKDLNHGPTKRALPEFLANLSNCLPGIVVTAAVDKKLPTLWGGKRDEAHTRILSALEDNGYVDWKGAVAEKMLNIVHIVCYLVSLLSREGQNLFWITDNDAIAANPEKLEQLGRIFAGLLPFYSDKKFGKIAHGKSFKERDIMTMDVLSCADLVAGTLEHFLTRKAKMGDDFTVSKGADQIATWLSVQGLLLKKFSFSVAAKDNGYASASLELVTKQLPSHYESIDIPRS